MESVVKQKLEEAEASDPGTITILGKTIHRNSTWFNMTVFVLVLVVLSAFASIIPKLTGAG